MNMKWLRLRMDYMNAWIHIEREGVGMPIKDQRKYKRWFLSSYLDVYEMNMNASVGYMADVSYGGMMLISKYPVQTNIVMPLRVELDSDLTQSGHMKVVTRSVRCDKDKDLDYYNIGLKLVDLTSGNLNIIKRIIEMYAI